MPVSGTKMNLDEFSLSFAEDWLAGKQLENIQTFRSLLLKWGFMAYDFERQSPIDLDTSKLTVEVGFGGASTSCPCLT